ncbi:sugar ABC transporter substrate-binding protein [Acetobacteraceae bacterium KSS8]|uniref:Sugar ABC transporter substrate-binding protein n=1 Tax=Endosaccharibacter trunci TaxID=2812733 RepID=A0ABT1W553_9PROT|nr:sugar ABC transporter substrate-binding protein [Acetobacteraceae bacterium KSS8]
MDRRTFLAGIGAAGVLSLPASAAWAQLKKPVVGLVMKSLANEFFKNMQEGALRHVEERGDCTLIPLGIQSETDIDGQIALVENLITRKVDAIVIAPADSRALISPLVRAAKAGIKLVNIDVLLDANALKKHHVEIVFVGPDNKEGAKMSADVLAKALGAGGKVVILEGNPGAANGVQRKEGFMESIAQYKLDLLDSRTAHWETEEANTVFSNMLTAHPDIQGVMAGNDDMAIGVVKAIEAAGKKGQIKVIGFDGIAAIQPLIKNGEVLATVDQFGAQLAADGIDAAMKEIGGQTLTGWVKTPMKLETAATI